MKYHNIDCAQFSSCSAKETGDYTIRDVITAVR